MFEHCYSLFSQKIAMPVNDNQLINYNVVPRTWRLRPLFAFTRFSYFSNHPPNGCPSADLSFLACQWPKSIVSPACLNPYIIGTSLTVLLNTRFVKSLTHYKQICSGHQEAFTPPGLSPVFLFIHLHACQLKSLSNSAFESV